MSHYYPLFEQARIDLAGYSRLTSHELRVLGVQDPGDLDCLVSRASALRAHKPTHPLPSHTLPDLPTLRPRPKSPSARPLSMPVFLPSHPPPPAYHHDVMFSRKERCKSLIIPREEEGREELPPYSCTVFKMGFVHTKREYDAPFVRARWRHWRKLYFELWGTLLRIYRATPPKNRETMNPSYYHRYYHTPLFTLSLAGAEACRALDYFKRPNVLRLTTAEGPQLLLKLSSHVEMISWIEHLQAAINISPDLEDRPMPKFITLPTRSLAPGLMDPRTIELERIREQRRREQREILI